MRSRVDRAALRRTVRVVADRCGTVIAARTSDRVVALTYDDGPSPQTTPGLLDALAAGQAKATFFVLVAKAERHPDLIARMLAEGHEVAYHGLDHARLSRAGARVVYRRTREGRRRLRALGVPRLRWSRPTFGAQSPAGYLAVRATGLQVALWSGWARDWEDGPPADYVANARPALVPGGVLLLHDDYEPDLLDPTPPPVRLDRVRLLRDVLAELHDTGLRPVTLTELFRGRRRVRRWSFAR